MTSLSDDYPVLLGPVRLETRYTDKELLIRVFPDGWSIDKFESLPTQAELSALDAYWTGIWRSGGDPAREQAAWHELTGRVPAGRASWLLQPTQNHQPANPGERPTGVPVTTTVLVILSRQALAANDRQPAVNYWTAVWRAHGDRLKLRQADVALLAAVNGSTTRAKAIRGRVPAGAEAAPVTTGDDVLVSFLVLPLPAADQIAKQSWTEAATAGLLPDRFTAIGYVGGQQAFSVTGAPVTGPLAVSPEPGAEDQLRVNEQTGELHVPDSLRWLTDFDRAVQIGMGIRVPLTDLFRHKLDRLVVFGLREQRTPQQSAADLAGLITRQLRSPSGFSLLPQGTPTNNTEQAPAGQEAREEAESGLRTAFGAAAAAVPGDWQTKTDGTWFAELLGLDPVVLTGMPNADRTDQRDARAANTALWPATWGNFLLTMMHPILGDQEVAQTRDFFVKYVSGRGPVPTVKIGRQPYGILPTTAFSRLAFPAQAKHRRGLRKVLDAVAQDWRKAAATVSNLAAEPPEGADPHQLLLDILALHPTSVEFHQRYAQSVDDIYNRENLLGLGQPVMPALYDTLAMAAPIHQLLERFGASVPQADRERYPDLIRRLFIGTQYPLHGPVVDDRPLSETDGVRAYLSDGGSYLDWLAEHAGSDLDVIRLETGFTADRRPAALLYLFLRHAVLLGWAEAGRRLAIAEQSTVVPSPTESTFVNVKFDPGRPSESRYRQLYAPDAAITGSTETLVHEHIPVRIAQGDAATAELAEQVAAIGRLAGLPTARLERVFAEHLDCATYRLDAWQLGLANERLAELRYGPAGTAPAKRGLHLGAYGWLENLRRRDGELEPVALTGPLAKVFAGPQPLRSDPDNGGYIHAPSPSHATTAAVLRAGYLANTADDEHNAFAVNLSSDRVRVALSLLDGMRQGQSLGALLGYRFERGVHEGHVTPAGEPIELDVFLPLLRTAFPLRAGKLPETAEPGAPAELVEARNVVDGLALVRRATREGAPTYPFGEPELLPDELADADQKAALNQEVERLVALNDALADLAVAEGTHQALLGNPERASATLDAYAKEGLPPDPAVVQTPRSGVTLTHRLGLQLKSGLNPGSGHTPRAKAEPAVNEWLPVLLPKPQDVAARVTWTDPANGNQRSSVVTQSDLGLQPLDLLWEVRQGGEAGMTGLDDRIIGQVVHHDNPRPDAVLTIRYTERISNKITFFELATLIDTVRSLLTTARPLRPSDLVPAASGAAVDRAADDVVSLPRERPAAVRTALDNLRKSVQEYLGKLSPLYPPEPALPNRAALLDKIDTFLTGYADLVSTADGFGLVRSGWGELAEWRRAVFTDVLAAVAATAARMGRALAEADELIDAYDHLPSATGKEERFRRLQQIERLLTTKPTSPLPSTPQQFRSKITIRRAQFDDVVDDLKDIAKTNEKTLRGLLEEVADELPLTDFDPAGLELTPFEDRVVAFGRDLLARAQELRAEITGRLTGAEAALAAYDQAVPGPDRVQAGIDALKALLGEDVLAVPEFTPVPALLTEWRNARNDSDELVEHLADDFDRDFPVDDWLHGMARVRERPRLWEKAVLLSDALRRGGGLLGNLLGWEEPALTPVQLPYEQHDHWLGMEFAAGAKLDRDRVLFTAYYSEQQLTSATQCGLLFDEWTEVIPASVETTGIAVHYDQPDSEPPQAMVLVVPPDRKGTWDTGDLVAAIHETFDLATLRAVEPEHLDDTPYAHLLPATVMSATRQQITISTDLALSNLRKAP